MIEEKHITGVESAAYIRKELSGGRLLSSLMLEVDINKGKTFALIPKGSQLARMFRRTSVPNK